MAVGTTGILTFCQPAPSTLMSGVRYVQPPLTSPPHIWTDGISLQSVRKHYYEAEGEGGHDCHGVQLGGGSTGLVRL